MVNHLSPIAEEEEYEILENDEAHKIKYFCTCLKRNDKNQATKQLDNLSMNSVNIFARNCIEIVKNHKKYNEYTKLMAQRFAMVILLSKSRRYDKIQSEFLKLEKHLEEIFKIKNLGRSLETEKKLKIVKSEKRKSTAMSASVVRKSSEEEIELERNPKFKCTEKEDMKPCQKKETPSIDDPSRIFYTSLYKEDPESPMAITWIVEHGAYIEEDEEENEDDEYEVVNTDDIVEKYKELGRAGKLIK